MKGKSKTLVFFALIALSLVFVILWQLFLSDNINFYITSVSVLILSMLPFFFSFEIKKVDSKEITLVATLTALAFVSRAAFYLIPQVKPIAAVVIVSAVCLGAERGYIIGALSMFVSNFIFSQGIWTPFQMVALGLIGFFAGIIFKKLPANRYLLALYGFVSATFLYGLIVDISTIFMTLGDNINLSGVLSIYAAGMTFNLIFGATTAVFLFLFGEGFIRKIKRVDTKYNIVHS
ncbi:MAG: ECF transporter S component [Eubacterium sp.]|nr:ECF transporter S component [Eubacterium sp.]